MIVMILCWLRPWRAVGPRFAAAEAGRRRCLRLTTGLAAIPILLVGCQSLGVNEHAPPAPPANAGAQTAGGAALTAQPPEAAKKRLARRRSNSAGQPGAPGNESAFTGELTDEQ